MRGYFHNWRSKEMDGAQVWTVPEGSLPWQLRPYYHLTVLLMAIGLFAAGIWTSQANGALPPWETRDTLSSRRVILGLPLDVLVWNSLTPVVSLLFFGGRFIIPRFLEIPKARRSVDISISLNEL